MAAMFTLPKKAKDRIYLLNRAVAPAKVTRNIRSVEWWLIHYYMEGYRRFTVMDWQNGTVGVAFQDERGAINFRWEEALYQYQTEVGRLLKTDVAPATSGDGLSLDAMRKAAVGQAVLNEKASFLDLDTLKASHMQQLVKYGTVGLGQWETPGVDGKVEYQLENVPTWQLLGIPDPGDLQTLGDLQGVVRHRYVPLAWLKKDPRFAGKLSHADKGDLKIRHVPLGQTLVTGGPTTLGGAATGGTGVSAFGMKKTPRKNEGNIPSKQGLEVQEIVELHEFWALGNQDTTTARCIWVGDVELDYIDYFDLGIRKVMPLTLSRYTPIDAFYGRGLMSRILGLNHEAEQMMRNLIENVKNMDEFGWIVIPNTLGLNDRSFKQTSKPRRLWYSPDYSDPNSKPFVLSPHTTGDFPGRMAQMVSDSQRRVGGQGEIFSGSAPGRTDSGSALGFLYETNAIPLSVPAGEIRHSFRQAYASLLQSCKNNYNVQTDSIKLTTVDDTVAGIVIDPTTGVMNLQSNPIPNPWEINIDIKDALPMPKEQRKQELMGMFQAGLVDPLSFAIINYRENLGFPIDFKAEWETYQKAVFQNIVLFGDGIEPGIAIRRGSIDLPHVFMKALTDFTSKIQFGLAGPKVRRAFEEIKAEYERALQGYPAQMPYPEEMGEMIGQMGGGGGGGAGGDLGGIPPEALAAAVGQGGANLGGGGGSGVPV